MATEIRSSFHEVVKIPNLNEDVVILILSKLPVKSLKRFKCVCKSWYSLISSPNFIAMHFNNKNRHKDCLAFVVADGRISLYVYFLSYHSMQISSSLSQKLYNGQFIGFCNGLLCVVINESTFYIINPATKESKVLKEPNKPSESPSYGFTFDSKANDYKLVRVTIQKTEVLTLRSNSWRSILMTDHNIRVMKEVRTLVDLWSTAVMKNAFHWIGLRSHVNKKVIVAFDLANEEFREIKIPDSPNSSDLFGPSHCYVFQDCLSITFSYRFCSDSKIEVWAMKEYGVEGSWTKQYCFSTSTRDLSVQKIFAFIRLGTNCDWPFRTSNDQLDISSAFSTKESFFDNIILHPDLGGRIFNYTETLVPIDRREEDQFLFGW
ncbi:F-box domain containing protein [Parasponia andersonii]|uniref:F-box domain containing protein n=1 Tax=Parasponia andersonii TaxID=3476 RepID=A0A2P5AZ48_PARAD|nr:F-box domain containing protein [Parasponia andersonii]